MVRLGYLILGAVVLLPVAAIAAFWGFVHFVQSPLYAAQYFNGLTKIERVEASRRWHWGAHPWGGHALGCSFAIATLPLDAPATPPVRQNDKRFPWNWPSEWESTPVATKAGHHAILDDCAYALSEELVLRLRKAHDAAGSFYVAGLEQLFIYSPEHRIIARIRFGD